jgi:hypothetical protein
VSVDENDFITNPVMLAAVQVSSRFDRDLEDDFEGAGDTLNVKSIHSLTITIV